MKFPDFHNGRAPIPFTRKEYESWGKERKVGRSKFVLQSVLWTGAVLGLIANSVLFFDSNRGIFDAWPLLITVSAFGLIVGMATGWFVSNMVWSISESRYAATNPSDLDDENLEAGRIEQNWIAISGVPFLIGMVAVLFVPEKFASIGLVGIGMTMTWLGYIMLSSPVEKTNDSFNVSRTRIWFLFLVGIVVFVYFRKALM